jgi:hypothetical protein
MQYPVSVAVWLPEYSPNLNSSPDDRMLMLFAQLLRCVPPTISTVIPSANTVAVCPSRGMVRWPVTVKPSLSEANNSAPGTEIGNPPLLKPQVGRTK